MEIPTGSVEVICQKWQEIERGWGIRPDGFSLHVSKDSLEKFVLRQKERAFEYPEEFSVPDSNPYSVGVDDETFQDMVERGGYRWYDMRYYYPGNGGEGGWYNVHE